MFFITYDNVHTYFYMQESLLLNWYWCLCYSCLLKLECVSFDGDQGSKLVLVGSSNWAALNLYLLAASDILVN